jgi:hypothetical protein
LCLIMRLCFVLKKTPFLYLHMAGYGKIDTYEPA